MTAFYWITWEAIYEGFTYSETVDAIELNVRLTDDTIRVISIEPLD